MFSRADALIEDKAADGTYEWILDTPAESSEKRCLTVRDQAKGALLDWLSADHGLLHITGKPGAGKSTLMSFLKTHQLTQDILHQWAGNRTLVLSSFYFSTEAQTPEQRSIRGLYRTLLYEILRQFPELIPITFPRQWELLSNVGIDRNSFTGSLEGRNSGSHDIPPFRESDITKAFEVLFSRGMTEISTLLFH